MQGTVAYHTQVHHVFRINKWTWALLSLICLFVVVVVAVVVVVIVLTKSLSCIQDYLFDHSSLPKCVVLGKGIDNLHAIEGDRSEKVFFTTCILYIVY